MCTTVMVCIYVPHPVHRVQSAVGSNLKGSSSFFLGKKSSPGCSWLVCCAFAFLPRSFHMRWFLKPSDKILQEGANTHTSQQLGNQVERQGKANKSTTTPRTAFSFQEELPWVGDSNPRHSAVFSQFPTFFYLSTSILPTDDLYNTYVPTIYTYCYILTILRVYTCVSIIAKLSVRSLYLIGPFCVDKIEEIKNNYYFSCTPCNKLIMC